jgi:hypothetical protein
MAFGPQHRRHPPGAEKRPGGEQLVDPSRQRRIVIIIRCGSQPIDAGAGDSEQLTLPANRQFTMAAVNERAAVRGYSSSGPLR